MTEKSEGEAQEGDAGGAGTPFDEDPPVNPGKAQVGNSKARFFVPRDDEEDETPEGGDEGDTNE